MIVDLVLYSKAFSVNGYFYRTRSIKTAEARLWEQSILDLLEEYRKPLSEIADDHTKQGGTFNVLLTFYYPKHILFNRAGAISSKAFDLSNVEKPIIDLIFGKIMNVNDKYIVRLVSEKQAGATHAISASIQHVA